MAGYRLARYDEEIRHEAILTNPGDKKIWKENGGKLINFKDWLIGNKRSHNDKVEEEEWRSESHSYSDVMYVGKSKKFKRCQLADMTGTTHPTIVPSCGISNLRSDIGE